MPPPGHEPLLRAICENPEDDTVRLVYADWLDENGDAERAEFIRVQVERARLRTSGADSEVLQKRDLELRNAHTVKWHRELPRLSGMNWQRFWRGFVSGASIASWHNYAQQAGELFTATPIQFLTVSHTFAENASRFGTCGYVTRLIGLTIRDRYSGWDAQRLCQALPAGVFEWVEMRIGSVLELSEDNAKAIGTAVCFRGATSLRIRGTVSTRAAKVLRKALGDRVSWSPLV